MCDTRFPLHSVLVCLAPHNWCKIWLAACCWGFPTLEPEQTLNTIIIWRRPQHAKSIHRSNGINKISSKSLRAVKNLRLKRRKLLVLLQCLLSPGLFGACKLLLPWLLLFPRSLLLGILSRVRFSMCHLFFVPIRHPVGLGLSNVLSSSFNSTPIFTDMSLVGFRVAPPNMRCWR